MTVKAVAGLSKNPLFFNNLDIDKGQVYPDPESSEGEGSGSASRDDFNRAFEFLLQVLSEDQPPSMKPD